MSDNKFLKSDKLKSVLSRIKSRVESGIANAISDSASSLNSSITNGDASTLNSAKSYADGLKTTLDTTIASNLATAKGYTDGVKTALETNINSYGVSGISFDNSTSVLTITMKDNSTKTATITGVSSSGSNSSSEVTLASLGAAAASHTHTESDITDLGSYATASDLNTYGVSSISFNDSTNVLSLGMKDGSTKTITIPTGGGSSSSSSGSSSIFPVIQRDESYNINDIVMTPTRPTIYLQALNYGFTDSNDSMMESLSGLTFDPSDNYNLIQTSTDYNRDLTTYSYYNPGSIFLDGFMLWITGDIMDGHQVGDIVFRPYDSYAQHPGYFNLATSNVLFSIASSLTGNNNLKINFKGIRLLRKYINDGAWLQIENSDISAGINIFSSSAQLYFMPKTTPTNKFLFNITFNLNLNNSLELFNDISTYASNNDINLLLLFGLIQFLNQYLEDPLAVFYGNSTLVENVLYLSSYDVSTFNSKHNLSYTDQEYLDFTNILIDLINNSLLNGGSIQLNFNSLDLSGYYPKMVNYTNASLLQNAGLPNITGTWNYTRSMIDDNDFSNRNEGAAGFKSTKTDKMSSTTATNTGYGPMTFDASNSNSIYGNSTTVTPQNIGLIPYIKY